MFQTVTRNSVIHELYIHDRSPILTWNSTQLQRYSHRSLCKVIHIEYSFTSIHLSIIISGLTGTRRQKDLDTPPKLHDVGENNVGEKVCWRKKICSFKIICTLVNYVGENFSVCWRKAFLLAVLMLVKDIDEKCMLVKYVGENFYQHAAFTHIFTRILCWWKPSKLYLWCITYTIR